MNLLQNFFLEFFILALELADLIDAVMIDSLSQVFRNFKTFTYQKLFNQVVYLSERQFEHILALKRREKMIACGIFIQLFPVHHGETDQIVPAKMCCEEDAFKIFLHIPTFEATVPCDSVEQGKSFMLSS